MTKEPFYRKHWVDIEPDRLARYQEMFLWNPDSSALYESAEIGAGQNVAEFGCGPGHTAIEIARWVGPNGHISALDINSAFISQTRQNAIDADLGDRITAYECDGSILPLSDACLDRVTTRNTLIYVDRPEETIREFHRVLRPGGKVHAIEGDWPMMVVEPIRSLDWANLVEAAAHACRTPNIGRRLYGLMASAGFSDISVQVITRPDMTGRLMGMIRNMAAYARESGKIEPARLDGILTQVEEAVVSGRYLVLAPQFVLAARR